MSQLLRAYGVIASIRQQLAPHVSLLAPAIADVGPSATAAAAQGQLLGSSSSNYQLQQQRGAAAKKKTQAAGKGAKKGQQQPAKKQKQKMESRPFNDKDPLVQKLIAMLVPAEQPQEMPRQQRAAAAAANALRLHHNKRHQGWAADLRVKLGLKKAALSALPPDLRAAAAQEDVTPFPLTRHFLYDSPPDAYKQ
jgi:hypothetical protein